MEIKKQEFNKPIRDIAYDTLKYAIITGEIPAGSRIVETEYAAKLHISRTPLREALRKLERDGLVEYMVRRGVIVRAFTIEDIEEIYNIRNSLELLTIPYIIKKVTREDIIYMRNLLNKMDDLVEKNAIENLSVLAREFHSYLIGISKLNRIISVINSQDEYIKRFSALSIARESRRDDAHKEHYEILSCVENKKVDELKEIIQKHIERSKAMCVLALKESKKLLSRDKTN